MFPPVHGTEKSHVAAPAAGLSSEPSTPAAPPNIAAKKKPTA
jgi:hypothetical protein